MLPHSSYKIEIVFYVTNCLFKRKVVKNGEFDENFPSRNIVHEEAIKYKYYSEPLNIFTQVADDTLVTYPSYVPK